MINLKKMGGISALALASFYLMGFVVFYLYLMPEGNPDPVEEVGFLIGNINIRYATILFLYVISGFTLIILIQALQERLSIGSLPMPMLQTATLTGFIWAAFLIAAGFIYIMGLNKAVNLYQDSPAQAASMWQAVSVVFEGLGGGTEMIGGIWLLLVSWIALRLDVFPKMLNYSGLVIGMAGIISIIPSSELFNVIFGLGLIPWFVCLGVLLIQSK